MACNRPLARIEDRNGKITFEHPTLKDEESLKAYFRKYENSKYIKSIKLIPCARCLGCRLDYAKEWANRIVLESKQYAPNECWFLTLTYNDENIPKNIDVNTLDVSYTLKKDDLQKFLKRLRITWHRKFNNDDIRFFACGEYGDETKRPHYHAIIFNLKIIPDLKPYGKNEMGQGYYTSKLLDEVWGKGNVIIGALTWNSASYVARYVVKKKYGEQAKEYEKMGIIPEFVQMSNRPGIGRKYYEENKDKIYEYDEIYINVQDEVRKIQPPKYYDSLYEAEQPEKFNKIKAERDRRNENKTKNTALKTKSVFNVQEQREIHARNEQGKAVFLKRKI